MVGAFNAPASGPKTFANFVTAAAATNSSGVRFRFSLYMLYSHISSPNSKQSVVSLVLEHLRRLFQDH